MEAAAEHQCSTCMISEELVSKLKSMNWACICYIPPCTLCKNFMLHNVACTHTHTLQSIPNVSDLKISVGAYIRGVILH